MRIRCNQQRYAMVLQNGFTREKYKRITKKTINLFDKAA